jgi:D-alanine-D-alanine ligase-like ATP-grasp enzyme
MTNLSLVPEIAAYKGIKFESLVEWMVKDADYAR